MSKFQLLIFLSSGQKISLDFSIEDDMRKVTDYITSEENSNKWFMVDLPSGEICFNTSHVIGWQVTSLPASIQSMIGSYG